MCDCCCEANSNVPRELLPACSQIYMRVSTSKLCKWLKWNAFTSLFCFLLCFSNAGLEIYARDIPVDYIHADDEGSTSINVERLAFNVKPLPAQTVIVPPQSTTVITTSACGKPSTITQHDPDVSVVLLECMLCVCLHDYFVCGCAVIIMFFFRFVQWNG